MAGGALRKLRAERDRRLFDAFRLGRPLLELAAEHGIDRADAEDVLRRAFRKARLPIPAELAVVQPR